MNSVEAAARLGVGESQVVSVEAHPAGFLATLRNGTVMLLAETVARVYIPEVDDPAEPAEEADPEAKAPAKKTTAAKKGPKGAAGS